MPLAPYVTSGIGQEGWQYAYHQRGSILLYDHTLTAYEMVVSCLVHCQFSLWEFFKC